MVIPTSVSRPVSSFSALSSPSFCFLQPNFLCPNNSASPQNYHRLVVSCAADMGSSSDSLNLRQPHISSLSMPPFGVTLNDSSTQKPAYKWHRVLLKVSGEALAGDRTQNIDPKITMSIAREVASVTRLGIEVAIVVGGGNIFRGASWAGSSGLDRSSADYIGF